jgi:hypothetical protein
MGYAEDINKSIVQSQKLKDEALKIELRKYRIEYKKSIAKIQNIIATWDQSSSENLGTMLRPIEKELKVLSNKLTRSAKSLIGKSVRASVIDTKASISIFKNGLHAGAKIGMTAEVFDKVWRRALGKMIKGYRGISLSTKIWDLHDTSYKEIRRMIARGYVEGKYVGEIMNDIRGFLYLPEADMRTKYWKNFYKENPPGRGRYKSAYKNMDRLIRTEVTRAYREGTAEYASKKSWVKGIQWHRTPGHGICTSGECDEFEQSDSFGLGDGIYPPNAVPISHANCQCYITIVPKEESLIIDKIV